VALATGFAKTVVNNLQLGTPPIEKQILLRVKFAELDRLKEEEYGVNLFGVAGSTLAGTSVGTFGGNPSITPSQQGQAATYTIGQALNIFAFESKLNLGAFIQGFTEQQHSTDFGGAQSRGPPTARKLISWWEASSPFPFCKAAGMPAR